MLSEIFTFELLSLDKFVSSYQNTTTLAPEALEVFDQFLTTLDKFFDLINLAEFVTIHLIVSVKWYRSVVISSGNMIRANSNWYGQPIFDNILINIMDSSEIEDYTTYDGLCFGKVLMLCSVKISYLFNEAFYLALINLTSQYEFISVDSVVE
ncbi:unnamed protein product [Rhizophagus irregularis]|nr:unnamed protein product [Rhizophagus irregularis]